MNEQRLLRQAEVHTPHRFRRDCAHARHAADAAAFLAEQREAVNARFLELKPVGDNGCLWIKGFLDPEGGAIVRAALEPLARRCGAEDDRLLPQRLGDAFVEIHAHALDTGLDTGKDGTGRRQVPNLQVTATLDTLLGLVDAPAGELDGDTPVSTATIQRIACTANIVRVLLDPASAVIDVGRARRLPSPGTRRAVEHRDKGCVWPGCPRKVKWTQVHHLVHWVHGGKTEKDNLVLLCRKHHWNAHEGGWQVVRLDTGAILAIPPVPGAPPLIRGPSPPVAA
jgi:hypothetical protein